MDNSISLISVSIITRNRFVQLCDCIHSLLRQSLMPSEILVIDSESEDETKNIRQTFPQLVYVRIPHRGVAYARNRALEIAGGTYVAFIDDDCVADPNWLKRLYQGLVTQNSDIAGGDSYFFNNQGLLQYSLNRVSQYGECITPQDKIWWNHRKAAKFTYTFFCTLNILIKKTVFSRIQFDEYYQFWFEDVDFCIRAQQMGIKAILVPHAHVFHKNINTGEHKNGIRLYQFRNTAYFVTKNFRLNPQYLFHLVYSLLNIHYRFVYLFLIATYQGIKDGMEAKIRAQSHL